MVYIDNSNVIPKVPVKLAKVYPDSIVPEYQTSGAAGFDLHAYIPLSQLAHRLNEGHISIIEDNHPITVFPGERKLIKTGIRMAIPFGYQLEVRPRSGLALKQGITVLNSPGTVDHGYLDEIGVIIINHGEREFVINHRDRIAQAVLMPAPQAEFELVDELDGYNRGGGFGSSGVSA
jgi:dUTP pyrophosphatase